MRLSKTALFVAASLLSCGTLFAVNNPVDTSSIPSNVTINGGDTLYTTSDSSGQALLFTGTGTFIKNGTGILQYRGARGSGIYNVNGHTSYLSDFDPFAGGVVNQDAGFTDLNSLTGPVIVNAGELQVSGYLNYWLQSRVVDVVTGMRGVSNVVLNDTAVLNFINTELNVGKGVDGVFPTATIVPYVRDLTSTKRYNVVNNLLVGGIASGARTTLNLGADNTYRIIVNSDNGDTTSGQFSLTYDNVLKNGTVQAGTTTSFSGIGILAGKGDFIKTGTDDFRIMGSAENGIGRIVIGGGSLTLADPNGNSVATATSVNLVGIDLGGGQSMVGAGAQSQYDNNPGTPPNDRWKPGYLPNRSASKLVLANNQTIQNFQADFAYTATPTQVTDRQATVNDAILAARDNQFADEPYIPGTGANTTLDIGTNTLTVLQNRDGLYRGTIAGTGTINLVIASGHTMALVLDAPTLATLNISGSGSFIANANGLGNQTISLSNLTLYQDNAGTLLADIRSAGSIDLTASAFVNNSLSGLDAANRLQINANDQRGTLAIGRVQSNFTGTLNVLDGQTLQLGSDINAGTLDNSLAAASLVTLQGGDPAAGGRTSTLYVASGIQTLKNLQANANSLVRLGSGTLVLNSGSVGGAIIGAGNFMVQGNVGINAGAATYTGATIVKSGTLAVTGGLSYTSGLVLGNGATFNGAAADQTVGALFGRENSTVAMGSRNLVIGLTGTRLATLRTMSAGIDTMSTNYLSTKFQGEVPGGTALRVDTGNPPAAGKVDTTAAGAAPTHVPAGFVFPAGNDPFDYGVSGLAAATSRYLFNVVYDGPTLEAAATAAEADAALNPGDPVKAAAAVAARGASDAAYRAAAGLAFAGNITGTGNLVIAGPDRTILTGVNTYTGATLVQAGELQANWNSVNASSGVTVSAGALLTINADALSGDGDFTTTLAGSANSATSFALVNKVGTGSVGLTKSLSGFRGRINVLEGALRIDDVGGFGATTSGFTDTIQVSSGATLTFNQNSDVSSGMLLSNAGALVKNGTGTLTLSGSYLESGTPTVTVNAGTLVLGSLPQQLTINAGGVLQTSIVGTRSLVSPIAGAGTLRLVGDGATSTVIPTADNLFPTITVDLRGVTLALNGTTQTVSGLIGDAASAVDITNSTLVFNAAGNTAFAGNIVGTSGILNKTGAGTLSLLSTVGTGWTGQTIIDAGTLEATPQALGASAIVVNAAGTLALRNDAATPLLFGNSITGAGKLAKNGAGVIEVGVIAVTGGVDVHEGRLIAADGGSSAVFRSVSIDKGATFQVRMSSALLHDGNTPEHVTGAGNLAVSGAQTFTLAGPQTYTGNTELLEGAALEFAPGFTTLNGLAGDATSQVRLSGDLVIDQHVDGVFSGLFTGGTASNLTVTGAATFAITGDLAAQTDLLDVTVSGGRLRVDSVNTKQLAVTAGGTLAISNTAGTHASHDEYAGVVTGDGNVDKVGAGYLFINDTTFRHLQNTGVTTVSEGTLGGDFATSGNLVVAGGTLAPGNSPGTVTVNGNFTLASNGTLAIETNAATADKVVVTGTATIAGVLSVTQDSTPGSPITGGGKTFEILTAAGGVTGSFSNATANGLVTLAPADQAAAGYSRVQIVNTGTALSMRTIASVTDLANTSYHDGLGGLLGYLDATFLPGTGPAALQSVFDSQIGSAAFADTVKNLSPLGYGAEYAMAQDGENRRQAQLHDRLEQRRYDRGSPLTTEDAPWEAFVVGQSSFVNNSDSNDTATFDYRTYGGMGGLDRKLNDGTVLGAAIGYDNGEATLHDSGGKIEMDRFAATVFFSGQLTSRWYLDLGVTGGVGLYDAKRNTALGGLKSDNMGYSGGAFAETGTLVSLTKNLHLTPYVGVSYTHHEYDGFTEKGNAAALKVDGWSQDSLRAKIGTGLNYFVPFEDWKIRLSLDVNYAQELLDTDSDLDARFAAGGAKFGTKANALPDGSIGVTPSLGVQITEYVSASVGYTYEVGLDDRSYQSLNFAIRTRF